MRWLAVVAVMMAAAACTDAGSTADPGTQILSIPSTTASTTTSSAAPSFSSSSTIVGDSATTSTTTPPEIFVWPGHDPEAYAVVFDDGVELVAGGSIRHLAIPGVRTGAVVDGKFVFAIHGQFGTWVWPARPGSDGTAPGGDEPVIRVIGPQAGTEISTWFWDAALVAGTPTIVYSEIATETDHPQPQRLMLHDLATGTSRQLWDKAARQPGLSGEQQDAFVADVAIGGGQAAVLFGFGDGTWLEWYDLAGTPVDDAFDRAIIPGTILEVAISADVAVVGFEPELHRLVTEIWAIDTRSGAIIGTWSHAADGQHLRNLEFDGRWITAGVYVYDTDYHTTAVFVADITSNVPQLVDTPAWIALNHE